MYHGLTKSEKLVNMLSENAFLKLWTHPNPLGKKNKELCDCLIVCENNIIIVSVKEIEYKDTGDTIGYERWIRHAIEESARQIWGAERWLNTVDTVTRHDGRVISLPPKNERKYYRLSVSLGSKEQVPIQWGDLGHGFVHVCDEKSVEILFNALDTITDFIEYLDASEKLVNDKTALLFDGGGIEDLIALYIQNDYTFNMNGQHPNIMIVDDTLWEGWSNSSEYEVMLKDFKTSYIWDTLIEHYVKDLLTGGMFHIHNKEITDNDLILASMSLQPRRYRASLLDALMEFLQKGNIKCRVLKGYNNMLFVFMLGSSDDREFRAQELFLRCAILSCKAEFEDKRIIGIARDGLEGSSLGYSSDLLYIENPNWTEDEKNKFLSLQKELGYFSTF